MKKKVLMSFITIAFIALGFIAHNAFAGPLDPPGLDDGNGSSGGTSTYYQTTGRCPGVGITLCCTTRKLAYGCNKYKCYC